MQAIVQDEYGTAEVLELEEVALPVVGDDQVLIQVHAAAVNPYDWHMMTGKPYLVRALAGLRRPKQRIPGADVSGRVEAVGAEVTEFLPGDEVFGSARGAYAEYAVAKENRIVKKPDTVSFEQAASVAIAGLTALQGLRDKGQIQPAHEVLVIGASGGVGTFAVQIAKSYGARVTGVCSTRNLDMVRSIGADHVLDYTEDDFTEPGRQYDLILDVVGSHSLRQCRRTLTHGGIYVSAGMEKKGNWIQPLTHVLKVKLASLMGRQKMFSILSSITKPDLVAMRELMESGEVAPVIDRCFDLAEASDALRHQGEGHARGKTVIKMQRETP